MAFSLSQTLRKEDRAGGRRPRPAPQLYLALEAGRPSAPSARYGLDAVDQVVIGRGAERAAERGVREGGRTLTLRVPDPCLSSVHARLVLRGGSFTLHDAGSTNGSAVNGVAATTVALADGDLLELGETFFLFRAAVPIGADDPPDAEGGAALEGTDTVLPPLAERYRLLGRIAPSPLPVLVVGPTGSGKEVAARAVHALSQRSGPLVAVNCAAIAPTLLESELFGHRRGAFSGATEDRAGLVQAADGGTLFLDEVGELQPAAQAALLRALQERQVRPVGAREPVPVDFRLVCATNRDLDAMVARGQFRDDLLARLAGFALELPPLRERREDLGTLVARILARHAPGDPAAARLTPAAARALLSHDWPHNIRELDTCLSAALALAGPDRLLDEPALAALRRRPAAAPAASAASATFVRATPAPTTSAPAAPAPADLTAEQQARRAELIAILRAHGGNISAAARALGKPRSQVQRWLKRLSIDVTALER